MKKTICSIMAVTFIVSTFMFTSCVYGDTAKEASQVKTISVNGTGFVNVTPDVAEINFSITTSDADASNAQSKNNKIYDDVKKALNDLGVSDDDIKSTSYFIYTERNYQNNTVTGYRVVNDFRVKTKDKDNTGKYMDAAIKAGITDINGVAFKVEDTDKHYREALKLAIKNAGDTAQTIGESIGANNLSVHNVTEGYSQASYAVSNSVMKQEMSVAADSTGGTTEISYDDIKISATVSVIYSYE